MNVCVCEQHVMCLDNYFLSLHIILVCDIVRTRCTTHTPAAAAPTVHLIIRNQQDTHPLNHIRGAWHVRVFLASSGGCS